MALLEKSCSVGVCRLTDLIGLFDRQAVNLEKRRMDGTGFASVRRVCLVRQEVFVRVGSNGASEGGTEKSRAKSPSRKGHDFYRAAPWR
jgi:hypothetical protein